MFRKERLFDRGCFSFGLGGAFSLYSPFSFLMSQNLESLVTDSMNPVNSFLNEMSREYFTHGSYMVSGGLALMGLGACLLSHSNRIPIPKVKEQVYE